MVRTCLIVMVLFGVALRQTIGFMESFLRLTDLDWDVPHFRSISRRQRMLAVNTPYRDPEEPLRLLIDSGGIKVQWEAN